VSVKSNISRWIFASVAKHFDNRKETNYLHIDGMIRQTNKLPNYTELKVDGPYMVEMSRNYFNLIVEVNVYIQAQKSEKNAYLYLQILGIVQKSFTRCIPVYSYGNGPEDHSAFVGSLIILQETGHRLMENHAGQLKPSEEVNQSQIEGHYEMNLEMDNS